MNRHRVFEQLLARRGELTAPEEAQLAGHLAGCVRCREAAASYVQQDLALRPLAWERGSEVQQRVLAEIDRVAARPPRRAAVSLSWVRGLTLRATLAVMVASAIIVNLPVHATAGAARSPFGAWTWTSCNAQGYAFLNYKRILTGPAQFRGPGVTFLKPALVEAQGAIANPVYYVFPRSPSQRICRPDTRVTDILIAVNTRTGAELHAVGLTAGAGG